MKTLHLIAGILGLSLLFSGCTVSPAPQAQEPAKIEMANLAEPETQALLSGILDSAGVSPARQDAFFAHVDQFNAILSGDEKTAGFEQVSPLTSKYDPYVLQDRWTETHPDFMGYNCRITAFTLFGDLIEIADTQTLREDPILFDLDALGADSSAFPGREAEFAALYSAVPTSDSNDIREHLRHLQDDWAARGIRFTDKPEIRLISMVFHDMLDEEHPSLFIGHTGVLLPREDGLYFVEKLAFQEPYQCIRFSSREELNAYLMGKYDTDRNQPNAAPFILENDRLMEGYTRLNAAAT